jgi:hypothetical protein
VKIGPHVEKEHCREHRDNGCRASCRIQWHQTSPAADPCGEPGQQTCEHKRGSESEYEANDGETEKVTEMSDMPLHRQEGNSLHQAGKLDDQETEDESVSKSAVGYSHSYWHNVRTHAGAFSD